MLLLPGSVSAETVVAARVLRAQTIIAAEDLKLEPSTVSGALDNPQDAIGFETRVAIYAGQPIRPDNIGPPAIVDRNQKVTLIFRKGGLSIFAEGRALSRGGIGDTIRVMNSASKTTVLATLAPDGAAYVQSQ
ncbi:flagellar basal body P-ring formation chaperone FlgA [Paenirhodobacter sp.]|uniref:flagellar basal body P-ring formation chaperone FlgA n=1 Tax=Paenirhodobacter sp. TaxID=1965326 RepID=UPI003B50A919